ncbi:hypothetical protein TTX_1788 [Thermoproteus tenax Kra 1]|uniref:Uncharacterized protein n=1 Tax=Thermoproteus tenax (strain ATCC 35583 / DSM 2078 / JCM 9277 / NBRC 100435 / Kra 1) TaxID=768679 RepID=G4RLG3_THETK|nr:hypothetical protein TTX_1788 [Thermoproteus tenax Kra 1]
MLAMNEKKFYDDWNIETLFSSSSSYNSSIIFYMNIHYIYIRIFRKIYKEVL